MLHSQGNTAAQYHWKVEEFKLKRNIWTWTQVQFWNQFLRSYLDVEIFETFLPFTLNVITLVIRKLQVCYTIWQLFMGSGRQRHIVLSFLLFVMRIKLSQLRLNIFDIKILNLVLFSSLEIHNLWIKIPKIFLWIRSL